VHPRSFTLRTMAARIGEVGDLWSGMARRRRTLRRAASRLQRVMQD
jgi:hypothetical protein